MKTPLWFWAELKQPELAGRNYTPVTPVPLGMWKGKRK